MGPWIETHWIAVLLAILIGLVTARSIRAGQDMPDDEEAEVDYDDLDQPPSFAPPADMPAAESAEDRAEESAEDLPAASEPAPPPFAPPPAASADAAADTAQPESDEMPSGPDNLQMIKGIGPKLSQQLQALGITSFAQIAAWTAADIATLDPQLEGFSGRIERDDWVGQAQQLLHSFAHEDGTLGA